MQFIDFPEISFPVQGIEDVPMPKMVRIREKYEDDKIEDIKGHLTKELDNLEINNCHYGRQPWNTSSSAYGKDYL